MDFQFERVEDFKNSPEALSDTSDESLSRALRYLSDEELHDSLVKAVREEKRALLGLLEHVSEGERRRLYAKRIFPSMHEYLRSLGYTDNQVQERIMASRLLRRVPESKAAFRGDKLNLTSMAMLERFSKCEDLKPEEAREFVKTCESKSVKEVWKVIASESTEAIPKPDQIRPVSKTLTKFVFEADEEFVSLFERAKELLGNPGAGAREIFEAGLKLAIKKREIKPVKTPPPTPPEEKPRRDVSLLTMPKSRLRRPGRKMMNELRTRAGDECERRDEKTGARCAGKTGLQADHYPIPYGMGGATTLENLRLACPAHNLEFAIKIYGREKMGKYLRR